MTSEEAYKILTENYYNCTYCDNLCDDCEYYIAHDTAVKALEKQIPKKPIKNSVHFSCAICGCVRIGRLYKTDLAKFDYCPQCGNKLDWSDWYNGWSEDDDS